MADRSIYLFSTARLARCGQAGRISGGPGGYRSRAETESEETYREHLYFVFHVSLLESLLHVAIFFGSGREREPRDTLATTCCLNTQQKHQSRKD